MSTFKRVFCFFTSLCLCFSFVAVWFHPVEAHADFGEFAGATDYFSGLSSAEVQALDPAGFAVAGAVFAVDQALSHPIEGVGPMDASSLTTFSGQYRVSDGAGGFSYRIGTVSIYSGSFNLSDGEGMAFLASADYDCVCRFYGSFSQVNATLFENGAGSGDFIGGFQGLGAVGSFEIINFKNNDVAQTGSAYFPRFHFNVSTRPNSIGGYYSMSDLARLAFEDYSRPDLLGKAQQVILPAGTIDADYPQILINWVNENYPEYTYLFPDVPPEPIYPTDFVTGIPKDWTIENPQLPTSPHIDFGQGDFDFSKPSEYLEEVVNEAEALDFWWWLSEKTFKRCGVFEYFLAFITLGFAMYALWRWGS